MKKLILNLSLLLAFSVICLTSCQKDSIEHNKEVDYSTSSIKASIPRIVENNNGGINVFVNVTDQNGKALENFDTDNLKFETVSSNGQTETLKASGPGQLPSLIISALTMDYSGSMFSDSLSIPAMENAIGTFISMKNAYDMIEIIKFSDSIQVTTPLTDNLNDLQAGLADSSFIGKNSTALFEALQTGVDDVLPLAANNPTYLPSVVGFTDGKNNRPPNTPDSLIQNCIVGQVPVYTVGYGNSPDTVQLKNISGQTGGQFFWNPGTGNINTVYQHINGQLTNTTIIPLPGPQTKGQVTIRVTATYECAAGTLTATAEKEFYY